MSKTPTYVSGHGLLEGKNVLVTAAAGTGIGFATAVRSAEEGAALPPELAKSRERIDCELVVNCLGAWSPLFSAKVGVSDVTEPTRRQICMVRVQHEDAARIEALLERIRNALPGVALRTTFIVGFPGETDAQFRELLDFVAAWRFERLGRVAIKDWIIEH